MEWSFGVVALWLEMITKEFAHAVTAAAAQS
jgi:hypothetical protein